MKIEEALLRCRDEGARVRPLLWRRERPDVWLEYLPLSARFVEVMRGGGVTLTPGLGRHEELLGEWEVVT